VADERLDALGSVPMFEGFSRRHLRQVLKGTTIDEYPADTTMVREGANGSTMFVVLEGTARVVRRGRTVARLGPQDVFGEFAVIDARPRTASVISETPIRVLVLYAEELRRILMNEPRALWTLLVAMASRYRTD